jgi:serine phosphatase RsbU (regulator of sigma subunit)
MTEILLDRIGKSRSISELSRNTVNAILDNINCRDADFLMFDPEKEIFNVLYSSNGKSYSISAIDPFFRHINETTDVYDREQINFDPRFISIKDSAEKFFNRYDTSLLISFYYEDVLMALLPLSGKLDNTSYTSQEIALLIKLKKIAEMVLHNLILFERDEEAKLTKRDILLASNIQEAIFQSYIPSFSQIDIYAFQKPAKGVSGDYFLIEKISNESMGVLIADVSGKGFSAALVSMIIHTITKSQEFSSTSTNAIVSRINDVMTSSQNYNRLTKTMSFATIFCGFFENSLRTLFYTNAGHHPIVVYDRKTKKFDFIKANGKPVGIFQEETYLSLSYRYGSDKIFVLYSDGITETINSKEEEFGLDRLLSLIVANENKTSRDIINLIISTVENYASSNENMDDMTLIVIKL